MAFTSVPLSRAAFTTSTSTSFSVVTATGRHFYYKTPSSLNMAGFGGGGGSSSSKKGKKKRSVGGGSQLPKLKPKAQWDRYIALKKATGVRVAVRVAQMDGSDGVVTGEWLEVGRVKSEGDEFTEIAVALQRGLIAEHSKRLYPLKVLPKDKVEWGFETNEGEYCLLNHKDAIKDASLGMEKKFGFEGMPDKATGFYCHYSEGRLVDKYDEAATVSKD